MKVHIDGDVIVYRAGYAAEHNLYHVHYGEDEVRTFDNSKDHKAFIEELNTPFWVDTELYVESEDAALFNVHSIMKSIAEELQVSLEEEVQLYLSGPTNYRLGIATLKPYKGNRDPNKKPVHAPAIKALMRDRYGASTTDGIEADDAMATAHYAMWEEDETSSVIATIDKDLDMIPGLHYNFVTKEKYTLEPTACLYNFWKQMITGDTVDNIPGIKGAGPAKAAKVLGQVYYDEDLDLRVINQAFYNVVRPLYVQAYGSKADEALLEMGRLLWIRRKEDEWWTPPTGE